MREETKTRLRRVLRQLARERRTATYRGLAGAAGVPPPQRIHKLTLLLEELTREDHAAGRPLLAALAVSRAGDGLPAPGYFQQLSDIGCYRGPERGPAAAAAHARQVAAAWAYWGAE